MNTSVEFAHANACSDTCLCNSGLLVKAIPAAQLSLVRDRAKERIAHPKVYDVLVDHHGHPGAARYALQDAIACKHANSIDSNLNLLVRALLGCSLARNMLSLFGWLARPRQD
ncbi:MAG TPA: hypothetical protein PKD61_19225 [Polyangiaceae bacterium]|nr:hypothetical protein [Polyangiaceae bacterium]